jgi:hypothetical protein
MLNDIPPLVGVGLDDETTMRLLDGRRSSVGLDAQGRIKRIRVHGGRLVQHRGRRENGRNGQGGCQREEGRETRKVVGWLVGKGGRQGREREQRTEGPTNGGRTRRRKHRRQENRETGERTQTGVETEGS